MALELTPTLHSPCSNQENSPEITHELEGSTLIKYTQ
jgi:hypothetical protein